MNPTSPKFKTEVIISPAGTPEEGAIWMFYPMGRSMYISQHPELYEGQRGMVVPTFEEEALGRFMLADGVGNGLKQGKPAPSAYLSDVLRIHKAGFLREYVWWHLGQPSWPEHQMPPNLLAFMAWSKGNLENHKIETHGGVKIVREEQPAEPSNPAETSRGAGGSIIDVQLGGGAELASQVLAINSAVQRGNHEEAARLLTIFAGAAKSLEKETDATYACFQSQRQLSYFIASHPELSKLRVPDWCVAWGSFLRVFLASRLQRFDEALAHCEPLSKLAPLFAQALTEKGYILMRLRRPQEALAAYTRAWELVSRLPENFACVGAVLRGQACALVELGDLDRAEKLLRSSLVVDPNNGGTKNELMFIEQRRSGLGSTSNATLLPNSALIDELIRRGLKVHRGSYCGPWPGIGAYFEATSPGTRVSADDLELVGKLGKVTRLSLAGAGFLGGATKRLAALPHLRQLDLSGTEFSDSDAESLQGLPELRWLNLFRSRIGDDGIAKLARLPKLEQLFLGMTSVSEAGYGHLAASSSLRYLDLEGNSISDNELIALSKLSALEGLNIACRDGRISNRGIEALLNLSNLQLLGFVQPPSVSEDMMKRLKSLPKLKNILPGGCAFVYKTRDPISQVNEPLI